MIKRSQSIISKLYPLTFIVLILIFWQLICVLGLVPAFMLPSPVSVVRALIGEAPVLAEHALISLRESFYGLGLSVLAAFVLAVLMDRFTFLNKTVYPVVVLTQTVPTIAIAPLLVLWMGYGIAPKVALIFITCFFPLVVGILSGLQAVDRDIVRLFNSMGASRMQILWQVKLPSCLDSFFSGLRIAATYAIVGAVIAEWLGGNGGLGVYMTRVRKSYAFDKMFAVILMISVISLVLIRLVDFLQAKVMPWKNK